MDANGVNYYKGVLLCSRPNQSPSVERQKPFCGRVNVHQQLGLVPTKQYSEHRTKKRQLPVLNNHKKWLEKFKKDLQEKKAKEQQQQKKKQQHLEKLRQEGREKMKQVTVGNTDIWTKAKTADQSPQKPTKNPAPQPKQSNPHKKKTKPAWAHTQQQAQENQQKDIDELLDFFQKGQTEEVKDYINDEDVKKILLQLKNKIETLKQQGTEWKDNEIIRIEDENKRQAQEERRRNDKDDKDDILSRISKQSGSHSVTSQKTVQRVEQLQKKKETKEWDKLTTTSKKSMASVDEQIAKHIADEILRNYPNLKHHSNQSVRKLLEKQAREQLKA